MSGVTLRWIGEGGTRTLSFEVAEISYDMKGSKQIVSVPKSNHILIPKGFEGPGIGFGFKLHGQENFDILKTLNSNCIVRAVDSTYPEVDAGTTWMVDKVSAKRTGGMQDKWLVQITMIRYYIANFAATPRSGTHPLTVSFTANGIGNPTAWSWTFGDGGSSSSAAPTHTYSSTGAYDVTLHMTFADGSSDTRTKVACVVVG